MSARASVVVELVCTAGTLLLLRRPLNDGAVALVGRDSLGRCCLVTWKRKDTTSKARALRRLYLGKPSPGRDTRVRWALPIVWEESLR
jgi:hypothetical protein